MDMFLSAFEHMQLIADALTADDLASIMAILGPRLGFEFFAITHHGDLLSERGGATIHLHNYPAQWADFYAANALGVSDPVHRASHMTTQGFLWRRIPDFITMTANDRRLLDLGRHNGIGDGFTVPASLLGEAQGSCSFANPPGRALRPEMLMLAQLVGGWAFEQARLIWRARGARPRPPASRLTDRQRECLLWAARGKTNEDIAIILGIKEDTVKRHFQDACERYRVDRRIMLLGLTLWDGTLTITEIRGRGHTPFWE